MPYSSGAPLSLLRGGMPRGTPLVRVINGTAGDLRITANAKTDACDQYPTAASGRRAEERGWFPRTRDSVVFPINRRFGKPLEQSDLVRSLVFMTRAGGNTWWADAEVNHHSMLLCHRLEYFGLIPVPRFSARLPIFFNVASSARNSFEFACANTLLISPYGRSMGSKLHCSCPPRDDAHALRSRRNKAFGCEVAGQIARLRFHARECL
jgi:hypothetical protein